MAKPATKPENKPNGKPPGKPKSPTKGPSIGVGHDDWPSLNPGMKLKEGKHEALADIHESIDELRYYREHFLKV